MTTTVLTPLAVATTATSSAALAAGKHTPVDATAGTLTMTLPTPATIGARLRVEKADATANVVTVSGSIRGGASTISLTSQFETVELFAESLTSWRPASSHRTKAAQDAAYDAKGAAGLPANVVTKTGAYTAVAGDLVQANAAGGAFTVTLPASPTAGQLVTVIKTDTSANAVTVAGAINGATNASITGAATGGSVYGAVFEYVGGTIGWLSTAVTAGTGPQGPQGNPGAAATVAVGTVTTLAAGSSATVTNAGTATAAVLNFGIPQGAAGSGGGGGGGGGLGAAVYAPASSVSYQPSTSDADVDTTNLAVAITVPASGKIKVTQTALVVTQGAGSGWWSVRSGGATMTNARQRILGNLGGGQQHHVTVVHYVTGLTPGAVLTLTWGFGADAGGSAPWTYAGPTSDVGPAVMIVEAM